MFPLSPERNMLRGLFVVKVKDIIYSPEGRGREAPEVHLHFFNYNRNVDMFPLWVC